jgi:hypothetical protein
MTTEEQYRDAIDQSYAAHHMVCYNKRKFHFEWGSVTHPGIWACGGGRKDLLPVFVGCAFLVPRHDEVEAWWAYIGPKPEFDNDFDASNSEDMAGYRAQSQTRLEAIRGEAPPPSVVEWVETIQQQRQQQLDWCKTRALAYLQEGDIRQALQSLGSDLRKDDSTSAAMDFFAQTYIPLLQAGQLSTVEQVRKYIMGFN